MEANFRERHTTGSRLCDREAAIAGDIQRRGGEQLHKPLSRLAGQVACAGCAGEFAELSGKPVGQVLAKYAERATTTCCQQQCIDVLSGRPWEPVDREPWRRTAHRRRAIAFDEPVATDVENGRSGEAEVGAERAAGERLDPFAGGGGEDHFCCQRKAGEFRDPVA